MTALAQRPVKSGSVIVKEYGVDVGFNREAATVQVITGTEVGLVVKTDGDGTWSPVVAADVATISGVDLRIVIDDYLYDTIGTATLPADLTVAVLAANTGVMIGDANLSFGDSLSAGQIQDVIDELVVQGFRVVSQAPQV
mgnify:CR=1 FL=1